MIEALSKILEAVAKYAWGAFVVCLATPINQTANSLLNKGIVTQGSGSILSLPFHVRDFVWDYLQNHREEFLPREVRDDPDKVRILEKFVADLKELF